MANEDFIFRLGADISKFEKSISQVEAELNSVKANLKNLTGDALAKANAYIQQLQGSLTDLSKVGFTGVAKGAQQGQTALFALGQVARDLPFGFIAIQNNLPLLVDQFVQLKQTTGGAGKALGAILNSIAGPAGLAFGFGVLTSAITGLVQEYGSLSNALGQIFGLVSRTKIATEELDKAQIKSKASAIAETQSINNLVQVLNNSKSTYSDRLGAYNKLKEIIPDVLDGLDKEKTINGQNKQELDSLIRLKEKNILLDGTRQALIKAIEKEAENAFTALAKAQKQDFFGNLGNALKGILKGFPPFIAAQLEAIDQAEQSGKAYDYLNKELQKVDTQISVNQGVIDKNTEAYKKQQKAIDQVTKAKEKERKEDEKRAEKSNVKRFGQFIQYLKDLQIEEKKLAAEQARAGFAGLDFAQAVRKQGEQATKDQKNLEAFYAMLDKLGEKSFETATATDSLTVSFKDTSKTLKSTLDAIKQVKWETAYNLIYDNLINPLEYLFDSVLEKGKFSWKEFGNIIIDQLKRIIVQIAATTAAAALANIIVPGAGTLAVGTANAAQRGAANVGGGGVSVGRPSAVNFGGIQGGIGLSGQVVFVQRGTDLVGVLNRSNATINRVG